MKSRIFTVGALLLVGCSGASTKVDAVDGATSSDVVAACHAEASAAEASAVAFASAPLGSRTEMEAALAAFEATRAAWDSPSHPCAAEGPMVTDRMARQKEVSDALERAGSNGTVRLVQHLGDSDEAWAFLGTVFATGRTPADDVVERAHAVDRRRRGDLMEAFAKTKKYGQLDDAMSTTCLVFDNEVDPNAEPEEKFAGVFSGSTNVWALCRLALPASKFAGDPNGKIHILLDTDTNRANGVVADGDLGAVEKWNETQYFRARFSLPQGLESGAGAARYHVSLVIDRPELGDEAGPSTDFLWHRE